MTNRKKERLRNKIIESRTRLTREHPFFAVILMYLRYVIDDNLKNVSTNGRCIAFSSAFLDKLYPTELDFLLCHTALHIVLEHIWRPLDFKCETYHHACDLVVNSILYECGYQQKRFPHLGNIYRKKCPDMNSFESADDIFASLIYRLEMLDDRTRAKFLFDSDDWWDIKYYTGREHEVILYATDDPIEYKQKKKCGDECYNEKTGTRTPTRENDSNRKLKMNAVEIKNGDDSNQLLKQEWNSRIKNAKKMAELLGDEEGVGICNLPCFEERKIGKKTKAKTDWRSVLDVFIQEQAYDYSFLPPDNRFSDLEIFLPDFNEKESAIKDVLFMIDTSGSFTANMIAAAFSEIKGAMEQFNGLLVGKIGFFDTEVHNVSEFFSISDIDKIIPVGGGGTDFRPVFDYVQTEMRNELSSLVILTDGYAEFPDSSCKITYPVLWLINNEEITPPFGKTVRILEYKNKL